MPRRYYGLKPDRHDDRDLLLHTHVPLPLASALPPAIDLRSSGFLNDPVFDQGRIGSCTANAISAALLYSQRAQQLRQLVTPARLAVYYWERQREGTTGEDSGAEIRDGLKVVAGDPGYVDEAEWPYDPERYTVAPPANVVKDAARDHATKYMRVSVSAQAMKQAIAAGYPVVVGFDAYPGIESDQAAATGMIPMPDRSETSLGGHAVLLVGYDDTRRLWTIRNSWGQWGDGGYGYLPYEYLDSRRYGTDFWTIQLVAQGALPTPPAPVPDLLTQLVALLRADVGGIQVFLSEHGL